jgi:hypothetical protein
MANSNRENGTGRSIKQVDFPTVTTSYETAPRGFFSKTDGTVKVKLTGMEDPVEYPTIAYKDNMAEIDTIYDDGTGVAITDVVVFW